MTARGSNLLLRSATTHDHNEIAEIWFSSASLPGVGPPVMPTEDDLRDRVAHEIGAGWRVTVAEQNNELVGFAAIKPKRSILDQLFVRPDQIGTGLGYALLIECQILMPGGFTLHTATSNDQARRFYERAGLKILRQGLHPRTGHPVTYYGWNGHS